MLTKCTQTFAVAISILFTWSLNLMIYDYTVPTTFYAGVVIVLLAIFLYADLFSPLQVCATRLFGRVRAPLVF